MSITWQSLLTLEEFPADGKYAACIGGWFVLVVKEGDNFLAVNDRCTHQASRLSDGRIRRGAIMCPVHGARFEAGTGKCLGGTYPDLRTFETRIIENRIEVAVPDEPPGVHERPTGV